MNTITEAAPIIEEAFSYSNERLSTITRSAHIKVRTSKGVYVLCNYMLVPIESVPTFVVYQKLYPYQAKKLAAFIMRYEGISVERPELNSNVEYFLKSPPRHLYV